MNKVEQYERLLDCARGMEAFDADNPLARGSLAYLVERVYGKEGFPDAVDRLCALARRNDCNAFCMAVSERLMEEARGDDSFGEEELASMASVLRAYRYAYEDGGLASMWIIRAPHHPDWFIRHEELQRILKKKRGGR